MGAATKEYRDLSVELYENHDEFRWDVFTKVVAHKLAVSPDMKLRAKLTHRKEKLSLFELSKEGIFLMKGVTDRERDLEDMALIAKTGIDYNIVLAECSQQSESTGSIWETGLYDNCEDLQEKFGIKVPILRKLGKVAEQKLLTKRIKASLEKGVKTQDQLVLELMGNSENQT